MVSGFTPVRKQHIVNFPSFLVGDDEWFSECFPSPQQFSSPVRSGTDAGRSGQNWLSTPDLLSNVPVTILYKDSVRECQGMQANRHQKLIPAPGPYKGPNSFFFCIRLQLDARYAGPQHWLEMMLMVLVSPYLDRDNGVRTHSERVSNVVSLWYHLKALRIIPNPMFAMSFEQ